MRLSPAISALVKDGAAALCLRPVINQAAVIVKLPQGGVRISVPMRPHPAIRWLRKIFPISREKNMELDDLGAEILDWCDGNATMDVLIERHRQRWKFSFFEARASLIRFFEPLLRYRVIALVGEESTEPRTESKKSS